MTDDIETSIEEETPTETKPSFGRIGQSAGHARAVQRRYRRHAHRGAHGSDRAQNANVTSMEACTTMPASTARLWNVRSTNDMLRLVDNTKYHIMYASPVTDSETSIRSLKTRMSLTREEAATLAALRIKVLEYENQNAEPCDWLISFDDIRALLATGAGFLTASNDEGGHGEGRSRPSSRACAPTGISRRPRTTACTFSRPWPMVLDRNLADQWLGSGAADGSVPADDNDIAGYGRQDDGRYGTRRIRFQHRRRPFR